MLTLTESSKRKKESLQPVFERITSDRDGRLVLQRADLKMAQAAASQVGDGIELQ